MSDGELYGSGNSTRVRRFGREGAGGHIRNTTLQPTLARAQREYDSFLSPYKKPAPLRFVYGDKQESHSLYALISCRARSLLQNSQNCRSV